MAAYAALTSLVQILDQLERHPFPPISLDRQQVESLTEIVASLQEFLEGYNSPYVDSDEADPLEMRIADAAYAAEDVIETYIVQNIRFAAAETHDDEVNSSSGDELNPEEETNWYKDVSSSRESICPGEEEINSHEEVISSGGEHSSFSGDELNSEEEINCNEATASDDDEVTSSPFVDSDEADPLEMRIADAAYAAEDVIESYIVDNIHFDAAATHDDEVSSPSEEMFSEDVWKVIEEMDLVKKEAMEKTAAATHNDEVISSRGSASAHILTRIWSCFFNCFQGYSPSEETSVQAHHQLQRNILRSPSLSGKNSSVMVGFEEVSNQLLDKLTREPSSGLQVIPITGMGGIGKTTLARHIFQHEYVKEYFDICVWVTISQQYDTKEILSQILSQATAQKSEKRDKSEDELGDELYKYLFDSRYLIIMDDIWSIEVWEEMRLYFPNRESGSRIVVTTRQSFLTSQLNNSNDVFHMEFLDEDNSWNLFSKTVFGEEGFPPQLEEIGKKIVEKCRGLPLSIVVIGGLLGKSQHTHEHWEHIEQNFNSIVNLENDEFCLKVLKLSYHHLPAYLKPSFLYMGIFEEDTRIRVSTLIKLWVSEGFLKSENGKSLETVGEGFLKDLIDRNLILADELGKTGNIKYCKMHDLLRDLCLKVAENERFYHVIGQHGPRGIQNHKRRCMVSDPWTSKERVLDALESTRSHVRSFINRSYYASVELLLNFRLLRILEVDERCGQYQLEDVIYKLVNSRYVAINTNQLKSKNLSSSVNFLWNLHTLQTSGFGLIVEPVEIWKMSQLRHVEFEGWGNVYLADPPSGSSIVILENLQTLKGIRNFKCGEEMVKRIPNIKKLQIKYYEEIRRHDGDDYCLGNLHSLHKLESLTIKVDNKKDDDILHNIIFPQSLIKLSLVLPVLNSVVGWEEMLEKIGGSLPLLQKLKLRWGVFKTGKWETVEGQFPSLKFLELSDCGGLKQWMIEESSHFPCLEHLVLSWVHQLEEIPAAIGEIPTLQTIELSLCSESAVKSAKKIVEEQEELQGGEEHLPFLVRVWEIIFERKAVQSLASRNFQIIKVSHYFYVHSSMLISYLYFSFLFIIFFSFTSALNSHCMSF